MQQDYYKNPELLKMPNDMYWEDSSISNWCQAYTYGISGILKELELLEDDSALALAKNLWYSHNADEDTIREQLTLYKQNCKN